MVVDDLRNNLDKEEDIHLLLPSLVDEDRIDLDSHPRMVVDNHACRLVVVDLDDDDDADDDSLPQALAPMALHHLPNDLLLLGLETYL